MINATTVLSPSRIAAQFDPCNRCHRTLTIPLRHPGEPRPNSIEPVIERCGRMSRDGIDSPFENVDPLRMGTMVLTAKVLHVDRDQIHRWTVTGLTANQADTIGIWMGLHTCLLWTDWFARGPGEREIAPFSLDEEVIRLRQLGESWKEIARELHLSDHTNRRTGKPWRADDAAMTRNTCKSASLPVNSGQVRRATEMGFPLRRRPDSNRGTGLCRPLPKPLGHAAVTAGRSA